MIAVFIIQQDRKKVFHVLKILLDSAILTYIISNIM